MSLKDDLIQALQTWRVGGESDFGPRSRLISSGLIDSVALFSLSLWIEERIGCPIDPTTFEVRDEWDTVENILRFIEINRVALRARQRPEARVSAPPNGSVENAPTPLAAPSIRTKGYEISRYRCQDKHSVAKLQTRLWSPDQHLNFRFFEWRYEENPVREQPLIYVARHKGDVIGMRGFFPTVWEGGEGEASFLWYCADDLVVTQVAEGSGLFAGFTEIARRDLARLGHTSFLSLSSLRVTRLQSLAAGAKSIRAIVPYGRRRWSAEIEDQLADIAKKTPLAWRLAERWPAADSGRAFERLDSCRPRTENGIRIAIERLPRPKEMAALIESLPFDGRFRQKRDERFFAWRFRNPLQEYRFFYAHRGNQLVGYAVLGRGTSPTANRRRVHLVDWEATAPDVGVALLSYAVAGGDFKDLVTWASENSPERRRLLDTFGFAPVDRDQQARGLPCILVQPLCDGWQGEETEFRGRPILDPCSWDLRMSYTSLA